MATEDEAPRTNPAEIESLIEQNYFNNHFSASSTFVNARTFTHRF